MKTLDAGVDVKTNVIRRFYENPMDEFGEEWCLKFGSRPVIPSSWRAKPSGVKPKQWLLFPSDDCFEMYEC